MVPFWSRLGTRGLRWTRWTRRAVLTTPKGSHGCLRGHHRHTVHRSSGVPDPTPPDTETGSTRVYETPLCSLFSSVSLGNPSVSQTPHLPLLWKVRSQGSGLFFPVH